MPTSIQTGSSIQDPQPLTGKPAVAFFCSSPGGSFRYEKWQMWRGIAEAANENGFNLIYIAGDEFDSSPQSVLYNLIGQHNVSGVIFWNSFVGPSTPAPRYAEFIQRYLPLPMVSIEIAVAGCANLLLDNAQGVRDSLAHLVEKHSYQRIAFLHDSPSAAAVQRSVAFEQVMREYGLFDANLMGSLPTLDQRGVRPALDYQAILAQSDIVAVRAIETLRQRGLAVPDDVAVTGFNDGHDARGSLPPLTSVRIPFRKMGRQAVEMLARKMAGQDSPPVTLPLQLVLRRSCGCLEPLAEQAAAGPRIASQRSLAQVLSAHRSAILADLMRGMGTPIESLAAYWAEDLLDVLTAELDQQAEHQVDSLPSQEFLRGLNELLQQAIAEDSNISRWHEAISALRRHLLPYLEPAQIPFAEDLWQQARVLVGQSAVRAEIHRSWQTAQRADTLREIEAGLLISADAKEMLRTLAQGLPRLGIANFFMVQYEGHFDPQGWGCLLLAFREGQSVELPEDGQRFNVSQILPAAWLPVEQPYSLVVEALHLRDEQIGYLVFCADPPSDSSECDIFQALRIQISAALKSVGLRHKLQEALRQAEEANALKSRFLSMVSHELRTPLSLIVGLSEMAMRQQKNNKATLEVLRRYNEQIYNSGQHLDRLIRDVLDLASSQVGQMKLISKPLDLVPVLQDAASMASQLAEQKNLDFQVLVPKSLPPVFGDKTRLRQVLLNLLSNAVKFTAHGKVVLLADGSSQNEVIISVSDTGLGIPRDDQDKIFDEFAQSSRTAVRGYGGIGLGLAITRLLVEMHGGRIWVRSNGTEGGGSTFSFSLPIMTAITLTERKPEGSRQGTVLILTKSAGQAQPLVEFLTQQGFSVEEMTLESGKNGIEEIWAAPPGAVVLDLAPAAEQGWEIMRDLKQNPSTQEIPVLFYSLMVEQEAGSVVDMDYLTKPVGAEQLAQALRRQGLVGAPRKVNQTVLVIDDEPGILEMHSRLVQTELPACQVLVARDGKQGLELMREFLPDLVLLDLLMPVLDGFGVLKVMQEEQMLRNIPVIVLSGQVITEREMARLNQSVAAVLAKGLFSRREMLERIQNTLARNKRLGTEAKRLVNQGMAFIHEHYPEPISRRNISQHLCVNEQYLSRCFNKELGIGPMAYLSRYRIEQAKQLLAKGNLSIKQIALEAGFSSQSYFSRLFQHEVGVTASAYQRGERSAAD